MDTIKHTILVASGKGGVGKSTVSANIALGLAKLGYSVGLLDADIYGPSVPTMFGGTDKPVVDSDKRIHPVERYGIKLMSMGYMVDPNTAMVWRGPMLAGAVIQFVNDVEWGKLDYLIFDLPPGTGDIQLSLAQKLKVTGALLVTTPQDVALADVIRAKAMFDRVRIPSLGIVENMSYFMCSNCDTRHEIFAHGGGAKAAKDLDVPFIGEIPIETGVREAGDAGRPIVEAAPGSASADAFLNVVNTLDQTVQAMYQAQNAAGRSLQIIQ